MSEFVLKTKEQETEAKVPDVQFDKLADEIEGAERAEGKDQVAEALLEVKIGVAQPEALLEWIDDLRDADDHEDTSREDDNLDKSFTVDFIPDTARDGAATETPPADDSMFFSANRRSSGDDDDDGGGGGGGGDGGGDGDGDAGAGEGGDAPKDPKKSAAGAPAKGKPAKSEPKQPPKAEPPPPGKGGGKKPDGK